MTDEELEASARRMEAAGCKLERWNVNGALRITKQPACSGVYFSVGLMRGMLAEDGSVGVARQGRYASVDEFLEMLNDKPF